MLALQIDPAGPVTKVELPDDPALLQRVVSTRLGGSPDRAVYHRRALMWLHGNAINEGMPPNVVATALASAHRDRLRGRRGRPPRSWGPSWHLARTERGSGRDMHPVGTDCERGLGDSPIGESPRPLSQSVDGLSGATR